MDLQLLRSLYDAGALVASVYLDTTRTDPQADKRIELGWKAARRTLAEQGMDEETLAALDGVVGGAREIPGPQGEAVFASGGQVLGVHTMSQPPRAEGAVVLPVPDPLQLAIDRDHQLPYVVVAVDRTGADVDAYPAAAHEPSFQRSFSGSTLHITRVRAGGPAHAKYHQRSVNLWSENTAQAADDVRNAADEVGAAVVLVAGDPKAVGLLREHLTSRPPTGRLISVEGGRADDSALAGLRASVDAAMHDAMEASHHEVLERLDAELAGGQALEGLPAVLDALSEGRVETLLLAADRTGDPQLYASMTDPMALATDTAAFKDDHTVFAAPAGPLLLRSATFGNAAFTEILSPDHCVDGVGALLRF